MKLGARRRIFLWFAVLLSIVAVTIIDHVCYRVLILAPERKDVATAVGLLNGLAGFTALMTAVCIFAFSILPERHRGSGFLLVMFMAPGLRFWITRDLHEVTAHPGFYIAGLFSGATVALVAFLVWLARNQKLTGGG